MRRLWRSLVLAIFVIAPVAQCYCAIRCADATASSTSCGHAAAATATTLLSASCPGHQSASPVAMTASRTPSVAAALPAGWTRIFDGSSTAAGFLSLIEAPRGAPPGIFGVPLRI